MRLSEILRQLPGQSRAGSGQRVEGTHRRCSKAHLVPETPKSGIHLCWRHGVRRAELQTAQPRGKVESRERALAPGFPALSRSSGSNGVGWIASAQVRVWNKPREVPPSTQAHVAVSCCF